MAQCKKELLNFLKSDPKLPHVVVMPDFFLDRIVSLDVTPQEFAAKTNEIVGQKGGSIDQISQVDIRGGNSVNVASALAALGARVTAIVCTSNLGLQLLRYYFKESIDISHAKIRPHASVTTALEFKTEDGKVNAMIRDLGSIPEFGPADLTESDYSVFDDADYVCVFNWAATRRYGTELASTVFRRAKQKRKCKTFCAPADPNPNRAKIPELVEKVLKSSDLDILSVNENEAVSFASQLDPEIVEKSKNLPLGELALEAARILAEQLPARIDLHTTNFATTFIKNNEFTAPKFNTKVIRATGSGDAWDAGNIFADANQLSPECRVTLANASAACYLSDPEGVHPTMQKIEAFLKKT